MSIQTSSDGLMRNIVNNVPVYEVEDFVFTSPPNLADARVAIVTTAGLRVEDSAPWAPNDAGFEVIPSDKRNLVVTHFSPNFDRAGFLLDQNIIYPIDRLQELADEGVIGSVASNHLSFMGVQLDRDMSQIRLDSGPAAAKVLKEDGVDVVLLTPVWPICNRTSGTLAHTLEANGLATIVLSSIHGQTERLQPPRALHCEFPLGRPLGRPNDPSLQRRILLSAFELLNEKAGPVFETFPEKIVDGTAEPLACPMPERSDLNVIPAVDEARGLRSAYDRTFARRGVSQVGRTCGPDEIPAMLEAFNLVADGVPWNEVGLLGNPIDVAMDIRAYYEEAAIALVDHVPNAQSGVSWLYQKTETGALMRAAQMEIKRQNLPYGPDTVSAPAGGYPPASRLWYYIMPQIQSDATFVDGTNMSVEEWEERKNQ